MVLDDDRPTDNTCEREKQACPQSDETAEQVVDTHSQLLAGIMFIPLWFHKDLVPFEFDIFGAFTDGVEWLFNLLVNGIFNAVSTLFVGGIEIFLFFRNPAEVPGLNEMWDKALFLYFGIIALGSLVYILSTMMFPSQDEADYWRLVERVLLSMMMVIVAKPFIPFAIELTNAIAAYFYPNGYNLMYSLSLMEGLVGSSANVFAALFIAIFGHYGIITSGMIFYGVLIMRMLLVYVIYGLFPMLIGFWTFDFGPMKYTNMIAEFAFKIFAVLLVLGIVVSAMLGVGAAIAGHTDDTSQGQDGFGFASQNIDNYGPKETPEGVPNPDANGGQFSTADLGEIILKLFAFIGTLWMVIATMTSFAGFALTAGPSSPGGAGGMRGRATGGGGAAAGGQAGGAVVGGGGGTAVAGGGAHSGVVPRSHGGASIGGAQVNQLQNGDVAVMSPEGGGVRFKEDPGPLEFSTETISPGDTNPILGETAPSPHNPEPTTMADLDSRTPLSEKAGNIADSAFGGAGESVGESMAGAGEQWMQDGMDRGGVLGEAQSRVGQGVNAVGEGVQEYANVETVESMAGKTWDKVPGSDQMEKAASLGARGAKGYHNVFKQPTPRDSLAESKRMASDWRSDEVPRTGGAAREGYGMDPEGRGDIAGRSMQDKLDEEMARQYGPEYRRDDGSFAWGQHYEDEVMGAHSGANAGGQMQDASLDKVGTIGPNGREVPAEADADWEAMEYGDPFANAEADWHGDVAAAEDAERKMRNAIEGTPMEHALDDGDIEAIAQGEASIEMGTGGYGATHHENTEGVSATGPSTNLSEDELSKLEAHSEEMAAESSMTGIGELDGVSDDVAEAFGDAGYESASEIQGASLNELDANVDLSREELAEAVGQATAEFGAGPISQETVESIEQVDLDELSSAQLEEMYFENARVMASRFQNEQVAQNTFDYVGEVADGKGNTAVIHPTEIAEARLKDGQVLKESAKRPDAALIFDDPRQTSKSITHEYGHMLASSNGYMDGPMAQEAADAYVAIHNGNGPVPAGTQRDPFLPADGVTPSEERKLSKVTDENVSEEVEQLFEDVNQAFDNAHIAHKSSDLSREDFLPKGRNYAGTNAQEYFAEFNSMMQADDYRFNKQDEVFLKKNSDLVDSYTNVVEPSENAKNALRDAGIYK